MTEVGTSDNNAEAGSRETQADVVERLLSQADASGRQLVGPGGLLTELTQRVLERALDTEMADQLGYDPGDKAGIGSRNSRNCRSPKTVLTDIGPVDITVPRDRNGTFEPAIVRKRQRRLDGLNDAIISLYARRPANGTIHSDHDAEITCTTPDQLPKFRPDNRPHRLARDPLGNNDEQSE